MENKKNLQVDAAVCDVRSVSEETLAAYGQVSIDCATLISNPEAKALLAKHHVEVSTATTLSLDGTVQVSTVNGVMHLTPGQAACAEKMFLLVNGCLDIAPGCEELLKSYAGIMVNGTVDAPESMTGLLAGLTVNGRIRTYPDGCIRLKNTTVLDRTFPLRAKQDALYHAASRIVALSGDIDFAKLAEKNVRFASKKLLVTEGLVEAALPLFDEKTDIQIVPDGCAYLDDDLELNEAAVRRYGGKLCIDGDLILLEDGPWLDQVTYLRVEGDVLAVKELEERLNAMDMTYDALYLVGGTPLINRSSIHLTRGMLKDAQRGVSLVACAMVTVDEDVPAQLLREKLVSVIACAMVVCTQEQRAVIELLAQEVAKICTKDEKDAPKDKDSNLVEIDAAFYTL